MPHKYLIYLVVVFSFTSLGAQPFSQDSVIVDLHVREGKKILKDLDIKLYQESDVIYKTRLEKGKTEVKVPLNSYCTMEVSKEGYREKRVVFDTRYHSFKDYIPPYVFDLDLIEMSELKGTDHGDMDFPVAIVSFNDDCQCLKYNEDYSKFIWERQWEIVNDE